MGIGHNLPFMDKELDSSERFIDLPKVTELRARMRTLTLTTQVWLLTCCSFHCILLPSRCMADWRCCCSKPHRPPFFIANILWTGSLISDRWGWGCWSSSSLWENCLRALGRLGPGGGGCVGLHLWKAGCVTKVGSEACHMCISPRRSKKTLRSCASCMSQWIKTHLKCQAKHKGFSIYVRSKKQKSGRDSPCPLALWEGMYCQ